MDFLATKLDKKWLVSLICNDISQATGACHRSLQLLHLLECDGWHLQVIKNSPVFKPLVNFEGGAEGDH